MNMLPFVESLDAKNISESDLIKLHEIEQDMWARWIWEFVKCNCCSEMFSKKDIFWHLSNEIFFKTVKKIMWLLEQKSIDCPSCWWDTDFVYWDNYLDEILDRYKNSEAYLSVYRDQNGEIRWFMDWYMDYFSVIYNREYKQYYWEVWEARLKQIMEDIIWEKMDNKLLWCSALWTEESYKSFYILFNIMKDFYFSVKWGDTKVMWTSEIELWTFLHRLHWSLWTQRIILPESIKLSNKNSQIKSDIFINTDILRIYRKAFSMSKRDFIWSIKKYKFDY